MAGADQLRVIDEWRARVEGASGHYIDRGEGVPVGGSEWRCECRVHAHKGMRDAPHANTHARGRRRTSTANAMYGCVSPREPKAANTIRIRSDLRPPCRRNDVCRVEERATG